MRKIDVVRAWKDEKYRLSLSVEELAQLPASPVGLVELADEDLSTVLGGELAIDDPGCTCTCCCCTCCCECCCNGQQ
jgi:mersacidin/lichenicidin family type 2 lantibiotic